MARIRLKYRKRDIVAVRFVPRPEDGHDPSRAGGPPALLTHLAGEGAVPAPDARQSDETPNAEPPPETAEGPASVDPDGNGAASSPGDGTEKAETGTPAEERKTLPPWVKF